MYSVLYIIWILNNLFSKAGLKRQFHVHFRSTMLPNEAPLADWYFWLRVPPSSPLFGQHQRLCCPMVKWLGNQVHASPSQLICIYSYDVCAQSCARTRNGIVKEQPGLHDKNTQCFCSITKLSALLHIKLQYETKGFQVLRVTKCRAD